MDEQCDRPIEKQTYAVKRINWGVSAGASPPGVFVEAQAQSGSLHVAGSQR